MEQSYPHRFHVSSISDLQVQLPDIPPQVRGPHQRVVVRLALHLRDVPRLAPAALLPPRVRRLPPPLPAQRRLPRRLLLTRVRPPHLRRHRLQPQDRQHRQVPPIQVGCQNFSGIFPMPTLEIVKNSRSALDKRRRQLEGQWIPKVRQARGCKYTAELSERGRGKRKGRSNLLF